MDVNEHFKLLGLSVKDKVTNYEGVVTTISFDLYGCIQVVVQPTGMDDKGDIKKGHWFDVTRLNILSNKPVMDLPDMVINELFKLLGLPVKDKVTNYKGIVTTISFDLYGYIQVVVQSKGMNEKGETNKGHWIDVTRLKILDFTPVMDLPDYDRGYVTTGKKGAAEKPPF